MARILTIIPYNFYPPKYGGALRCFHLLKEAAGANDVTLLTVQAVNDFKKNCSHGFPGNVTIESSREEPEFKTIFNVLPVKTARAVNSRILQRSLSKKGNLYLLKTYPLLKKILLSNNFDAVIYENLECFGVLHKHIKKLSPRTKHIYDAHNVDSELWKTQAERLQKRKLSSYGLAALREESNLYQTTDLCFCCSENDKQKLQQLNEGRLQIAVIPNGATHDQNLLIKIRVRPILKTSYSAAHSTMLPTKKACCGFAKRYFRRCRKKFPAFN